MCSFLQFILAEINRYLINVFIYHFRNYTLEASHYYRYVGCFNVPQLSNFYFLDFLFSYFYTLWLIYSYLLALTYQFEGVFLFYYFQYYISVLFFYFPSIWIAKEKIDILASVIGLLSILNSLRVFPINICRWFSNGVWVTTSVFKSPGFFASFKPISTILVDLCSPYDF